MPHCQDQVPGGGSDAKTREGPYQHLVPGVLHPDQVPGGESDMKTKSYSWWSV